jgi:hypothetical protein
MAIFSKNAARPKIRTPAPAPPEIRPARPPRLTPERPAAARIQITQLRQNLDLGIPALMPPEIAALRHSLEHSAKARISIFGRISGVTRDSFDQFGTGSLVRMKFGIANSLKRIEKTIIRGKNNDCYAGSRFGIRSGDGSIGTTQK